MVNLTRAIHNYIKLALCAALFSSLPVGCRAQSMYHLPSVLPANMIAPAFNTRTVEGRTLTLKSLRGKVVLLDYWATWCGPCQAATPNLESLSRRFKSRGLRVVGISVDDPKTVAFVKPYMKHFRITYTIADNPKRDAQAQIAYQADTLPSEFLIDKRGFVRWSMSGYSPQEAKKLTGYIKTLLAEKA